MPLRSMTGFARSPDQEQGDLSWVWEIKSVNGKNLDVRSRFPAGFDGWEQKLRQLASQKLGRGNVQVALTVNRTRGATQIEINEDVVNQVVSVLNKLSQSVDAQRPTLDGILSIRGVMDVVEQPLDDEDIAERDRALEQSFLSTLDGLVQMRATEGAKLETMILDQLQKIEDLSKNAGTVADQQPAAIQERLTSQLAKLLENSSAVSEEKLAHEVALLATKADVTEELDRLSAHVSAARDLISLGEPVGRRLDFLTQELNRETNTLCSKSSSVELTRIGLDLKATVDQIREQVQNVE